MPPVHVFLLALLGGYFFITRWYPTKYYALRSDGYRLVFSSSIAGAIFLFIGTISISILISTSRGQGIHELWHKIVPLGHSGKATIAFLLGLVLWWPGNILSKWLSFLSDKAAVDRAIIEKQDPLELLLRRALGSGRMVSVTVKNGKVYIGTLQRNFNPAFPMESISIFLRFSGHREKNTLQLSIDIDYQKTHQRIQEDLLHKFKEELIKAYQQNPEATDEELMEIVGAKVSAEASIENYEIVIPVGEIQSINMFDKSIYDGYFKSPTKKKWFPLG